MDKMRSFQKSSICSRQPGGKDGRQQGRGEDGWNEIIDYTMASNNIKTEGAKAVGGAR